MKLTKTPFEKIKNGGKIIESRLFDEKRQQINIGDRIEFIQNDNLSQKVTTMVTALYKYATFKELFSHFPPAYFGGDSKKNLLRGIHQFYSSEEETRFGVVGIMVKKK